MLDYLVDLFNATVRLLPAVKFDARGNIHRTLISLYASIIEQTRSAVTLIQAESYAGVEIILRSSLEAHVDLINLANDEAYLQQMQAQYHKEWIKLATAGVNGENPYLAYFHDNPQAAEILQNHRNDLAALEQDTRILQVFERFQKANMEHEYRSIYNSLCTESHNNIRALTNRHFRFSDIGKPEVVIFDGVENVDMAAALDTYIGILNSSNNIIHHYFESPGLAELKELAQVRNDRAAEWDA